MLSGGLILITIVWGGLAAGTKAGLIYNTFPLMDGQIIPEDAFFLTPLWRIFFGNPAMIQWVHRILALSVLTTLFLIRLYHPFASLLFRAAILQITLGALTVLGKVPLGAAVGHQFMTFILLGLWLWAWVKYDYIKANEKA